MFEKRVVRGNTHSSYVMSKEEELKYKRSQNQSVRGTKRQQKDQADASVTVQQDENEFYPNKLQPQENKRYAACFTEEELLYQTDLPPYHDAATQTELVIEKEIPDLSMPVYKGIHKETQVYQGESIFDFDYEADPLLQVLLTRILEDARIEVVEEEELKAMKKRQEDIRAHKEQVNANLMALQKKEFDSVEANVTIE